MSVICSKLAFDELLLLQQNLQSSGQTHPSTTLGYSSKGPEIVCKWRPDLGIANKLEPVLIRNESVKRRD